MSKGEVIHIEDIKHIDSVTGAVVRQVSHFNCINHHPFYYLPTFDDAMNFLTFVSHKTGRPEIFAEMRPDGKEEDRRIIQLSEQDGLNEWSVHPSHDGSFVYFTTASGAWRVNTKTLEEEELYHFSKYIAKAKGMVGAAMGTTTVSHDDKFWAVPVKFGEISRMLVIDTSTGDAEQIFEKESIGHPEFHPDDSNLLRYAGHLYKDRIWVTHRDGSENRLVYTRNENIKEWIVHETWRPGSLEILTSNWPHGVIGIDTETGKVRRVCSFSAWHPCINALGTKMCADTNFPDSGLQIFDALDGIGEPSPLCSSDSSNVGAHWNTDHCPYDDGPVEVYAPQHTHPHPSFSPDGKKIVFTSDRSGHPQVYEVQLPKHLL